MTQYLLSVFQPSEDTPPAEVLAPIIRNVEAVNREMQQAGAWVFAGGLCGPSSATVLTPKNGDVLMTDGPFVEGKEHLGGFTIVEAADLDAALEWGRRVALATTLPIEVRPFKEGFGPE
jgi:hypothetical protein